MGAVVVVTEITTESILTGVDLQDNKTSRVGERRASRVKLKVVAEANAEVTDTGGIWDSVEEEVSEVLTRAIRAMK